MRATATILLTFCILGCKPSDPKDPATWIARLGEGDARSRVKAVHELRKLKARGAAPALAKALADLRVREDSVVALGELGDESSVQPLLDAIDTNVGAGSDTATRAANRTNAKIADALGQLGDAKAGPALLRLARSRDDFVRLSATQALGQLRYKDAVGELAHIVDDEGSPPILVKKAIVSLGQIGDPAAIPALQHALVMEMQGVSFISEASYALFQLGAAAVEPMLKLVRDEDKAYLAWARERKRAPAGTYAKAALVLGDLGDARAVPVLLERLKYQDPEPIPSTARLLTNVVRQFAADALGRLRAKEAAAPILALINTAEPQEEELVAFATNALVWIGEQGQAAELVKRAAAPGAFRPRLLCAQAAALLGDPSIKKALLAAAEAKEKRPSPEACAQDLVALQIAPEGMDAKAACARVADERAKAFKALLEPLDAAAACGAAADCWEKKLQGSPALVRARAAYELGRAGAVAAIPALVKAAADPDLPARLAAIRALDWLAPLPAAQAQLKAAAATLAAQLQAEQGRVQFVKVNEELKRLHARLARL